MPLHYLACDECGRACWRGATLRCSRNAPRSETGTITSASLIGAPTCESERSRGWLTARLTGACGREARFWTPTADTIPEIAPHDLWGAVMDDGKLSGYMHEDYNVIEQWARSHIVDGIYTIVPVRLLKRTRRMT